MELVVGSGGGVGYPKRAIGDAGRCKLAKLAVPFALCSCLFYKALCVSCKLTKATVPKTCPSSPGDRSGAGRATADSEAAIV